MSQDNLMMIISAGSFISGLEDEHVLGIQLWTVCFANRVLAKWFSYQRHSAALMFGAESLLNRPELEKEQVIDLFKFQMPLLLS
jgi:hypothetical protein